MTEFTETDEQRIFRYENLRIAEVTTNVGNETLTSKDDNKPTIYIVTYNPSDKKYLEPSVNNKTILTDLFNTYDISANFEERVREGLVLKVLKEEEVQKELYPIIREWLLNDEPKK